VIYACDNKIFGSVELQNYLQGWLPSVWATFPQDLLPTAALTPGIISDVIFYLLDYLGE